MINFVRKHFIESLLLQHRRHENRRVSVVAEYNHSFVGDVIVVEGNTLGVEVEAHTWVAGNTFEEAAVGRMPVAVDTSDSKVG